MSQVTSTSNRTHSSEAKEPKEEITSLVDPKCIFCKILKGKIPGSTVFEDETCRIIMDIHPIGPGHVMIIPRKHFQNIMDMPPEVALHMMKLAHQFTTVLTESEDYDCDGANFMWNNGRAAWQTVMHAHLHVIPRQKGDGLRFFMGIFKHLLSLLGLMPPANRQELDRLAEIFNGLMTKHIKSS